MFASNSLMLALLALKQLLSNQIMNFSVTFKVVSFDKLNKIKNFESHALVHFFIFGQSAIIFP